MQCMLGRNERRRTRMIFLGTFPAEYLETSVPWTTSKGRVSEREIKPSGFKAGVMVVFLSGNDDELPTHT